MSDLVPCPRCNEESGSGSPGVIGGVGGRGGWCSLCRHAREVPAAMAVEYMLIVDEKHNYIEWADAEELRARYGKR